MEGRLVSAALVVAACLALCQQAQGQLGGLGLLSDPCVQMGQTLLNGACGNIVSAVKNNAEGILRADCPTLRNAVNNGPKPNDQCCNDIRSFIQGSCTCNSNVLNNAQLAGQTPDSVKAAGYVAQLSVCAANSPILNPCGDTPCLNAS